MANTKRFGESVRQRVESLRTGWKLASRAAHPNTLIVPERWETDYLFFVQNMDIENSRDYCELLNLFATRFGYRPEDICCGCDWIHGSVIDEGTPYLWIRRELLIGDAAGDLGLMGHFDFAFSWY